MVIWSIVYGQNQIYYSLFYQILLHPCLHNPSINIKRINIDEILFFHKGWTLVLV